MSYVFNYVVNSEQVTNLATASKLLVTSQTISVALATVLVAISSPGWASGVKNVHGAFDCGALSSWTLVEKPRTLQCLGLIPPLYRVRPSFLPDIVILGRSAGSLSRVSGWNRGYSVFSFPSDLTFLVSVQ